MDQGQLDLEIVSRLFAIMTNERYQHESISGLRLKLISDRVIDEIIYNMPTLSEVAALIVGDVYNPSKIYYFGEAK
ncbi:hypothetical protein Lal_00024196 [Lupinus albus]|nr:hypothetical protein Lal_00024196 [Lupinus albus]